MANTITVVNLVSKTVLTTLRNNTIYPKLAYKPFDSDFNQEINGYNVGNTVRYRRPTYVNYRTGTVAQPQALTEVEESITLDHPIGSDWNPNLLQLTTDMDSQAQIAKRFVEPATLKMANAIDQSLANALLTSCYQVVGDAGSTLNSWEKFDLGKTKLIQLGVPEPYNATLNPKDRHYLQSSMVNFFNRNMNETIGVKGMLGETSGVMCYEDQNIVSHTNGSFATSGTIEIATTAVTGATTLALKGFTASQTGVLKAGDIIYVQGCYQLNLMSQSAIGAATADLMKFIVQQDVNSDAGGLATVSIQPAIIFSANNPYNNVSELPTLNADVTLYGGASATYSNNFIFYRDALMFVMKPYFKPFVPAGAYSSVRDTKTGLVFSAVQWFDGNQFNNLIRLDGLYGFKVDPRYVVRVIG